MSKVEQATAKLAEAIAELVKAVVAEQLTIDPEKLEKRLISRLRAKENQRHEAVR